MKNIFKENKKLQEENRLLKIQINRLEKENTEGIERLRNYYDKLTETKIDWIKSDYNTKIKRKNEVLKICKNLENKLNANITSLIDLDITTDINAYLKLLDYLKGE